MNLPLIAVFLAFAATISWTVSARAQSLGLYDNFSSGEIDPLRWRGYEYLIASTDRDDSRDFGGAENDEPVHEGNRAGFEPSAALESMRRVVNGQAQVALTTFNRGMFLLPRELIPTGRGRSGLRLNRPALGDHTPVVRTFRASVTVADVLVEPPDAAAFCAFDTWSNAARVQIFGHFFNDGQSDGPGDLRGDIVAAVSLERRVGLVDGVRVVRDFAEARVGRCQNESCAFIVWEGTTFTRTWTVGAAHVLTITWRPGADEFVFTLAGGVSAAESLAVPYSRPDAAPPRGYAYDLRVEAQPTRCDYRSGDDFPQRVSIDARFDNVRLDSNAAAAR
jgi:hypothetical protein